MKVCIAASSSLGHINPALIFGDFLLKKGIEVQYLGFNNQMEEYVIPKSKLFTLNCKNSFNKIIKNPFEIAKLVKEIKRAKKSLNDIDVFIGFGGFITFLLIFLKRKRKLYLHEQNVILGDSNKIALRYAKDIFLSFPINDVKGKMVGNPVGDRILKKEFIYKNKFNILFIFGSLGSKSLLDKLLEIQDQLDSRHKYTLVTGKKFYSQYKDKFTKIKVLEYISLHEELINYDIVFSRGGASSLFEIISSCTYCVSIPSPYVKNNHQEKNVEFLENLNLLTSLKEKDFNCSNINKKINQLIDYDYCLERYKNMKNKIRYNCCELIYKEIFKNDQN